VARELRRVDLPDVDELLVAESIGGMRKRGRWRRIVAAARSAAVRRALLGPDRPSQRAIERMLVRAEPRDREHR